MGDHADFGMSTNKSSSQVAAQVGHVCMPVPMERCVNTSATSCQVCVLIMEWQLCRLAEAAGQAGSVRCDACALQSCTILARHMPLGPLVRLATGLLCLQPPPEPSQRPTAASPATQPSSSAAQLTARAVLRLGLPAQLHVVSEADQTAFAGALCRAFLSQPGNTALAACLFGLLKLSQQESGTALR